MASELEIKEVPAPSYISLLPAALAEVYSPLNIFCGFMAAFLWSQIFGGSILLSLGVGLGNLIVLAYLQDRSGKLDK